MSSSIIFRRVGGRIIPIKIGEGIKLIDRSMNTPIFKKEQLEMTKQFLKENNLFKKLRKIKKVK